MSVYVDRVFRIAVSLLLVMSLSACEEPTGPYGNFMLRLPSHPHPPTSTSAFQEFSTTDDTTLRFEWEPLKGAKAYEIAFWQTSTADSMNNLLVDTKAPPTVSFMVEDPELVDAPYNVNNENDTRRMIVVRYELPRAKMAEALLAAGLTPAPTTNRYFIWSVFAIVGNKKKRAVEVHRMNIRLTG